MVIPENDLLKIPNVIFGQGRFKELGQLTYSLGKTALIVTGKSSLKLLAKDNELYQQMLENGIDYFTVIVENEPSPTIIDTIVSEYKDKSIKVVVAIGGGSVVDAGKAISAMLLVEGSVKDYLEGVGTLTHSGSKVPFIAVPTTSGTGSEATKNAVITEVGVNGFKKSLRHDNFVPNIAVVDPELTLSCSPKLTAACGMDAFSQLVESYLSTNANKITDNLALSGIKSIAKSLVSVSTDQGFNIEARSDLAYASLTSGITLASAGLGIVHGIAGPLGGFFSIPHGVACGTLIGEAMKMTVQRLREISNEGLAHLKKIAEIGKILSACNPGSVDECCNAFVDTIMSWTDILRIPKLGQYGINTKDIDKIVSASSNKNNPIKLKAEDIAHILLTRL